MIFPWRESLENISLKETTSFLYNTMDGHTRLFWRSGFRPILVPADVSTSTYLKKRQGTCDVIVLTTMTAQGKCTL